MRETKYSRELCKRIEAMFPGCIILRNDPNKLQGVPDRLILFRDRWATLEVKTHADAPVQPNQPYYVDLMNQMSYSAFVYPENEFEVMSGLQSTFGNPR
jgi:hypothetical protein